VSGHINLPFWLKNDLFQILYILIQQQLLIIMEDEILFLVLKERFMTARGNAPGGTVH